jgi:hypothetical protein
MSISFAARLSKGLRGLWDRGTEGLWD